MADKCCGNCAWWGEVVGWKTCHNGTKQDVAACNAPIPTCCDYWLPEYYYASTMRTQGTTCPCHKEKDNG
jgi:hypothetical protein